MIKKIIFTLLIINTLLNAREMIRMKQIETGETKQITIELAHWNMFENALEKAIGNSVYDGNIVSSFKEDMDKDFSKFQKDYFRSSSSKCKNLQEDGYKCIVLSTLNIDKIKAIVAKKSHSSTTMGKNLLENVQIVLIDDVDTQLSQEFVTNLQASVNERGAELWIEKKGTQVGTSGNKCQKIKDKRNYYKRKGSAYKSALAAIDKKLQECKKNAHVQHLFKLTKIKYTSDGKDTYNNYKGNLTYIISSLNTQTGRRDSAVRPKNVKSYDSSEEGLKLHLSEVAAEQASSEITNNVLQKISQKSRKREKKKLEKYEYYYTVILRGITNDSTDRNKRKIIKSTIKELGSRARKAKKESTEFEQVYNFGLNEELDTEEFGDMLYDMADSLNFQIKVIDKGDNIIIVQFQ